ncbi:hypothetical protein SLINC_2903 [Streptomyces lincolnensis]|uniref:Uncharacterized protein n=1 Tax=Streptomyces lincolnensis TaxID=1915 RepID=A0A1B1M9J3_STRLN|nr:hypothetical protein SLINC_2903 [Streptomyces lincolnensis]
MREIQTGPTRCPTSDLRPALTSGKPGRRPRRTHATLTRVTLPTTTPYDADRAAYSRETLARLALCSQAVDTARTASVLVATRNDVDTGLGGRASEALSLIRLAERTLVRAVVYERERGASWEDIGRYLELDPAEAEERFAPALAGWEEALETPCRLDPTGRRIVNLLPSGAHNPKGAVRSLDLWARLHLYINDRHPVSGGLSRSPAPHDLEGLIRVGEVRRFLGLLSGYLGQYLDNSAWDAIARGLEPTDDSVAAWYTHTIEGPAHTLRVRLAHARPHHSYEAVEPDTVSVVVTGSDDSALSLRVDTLLDVFGVTG